MNRPRIKYICYFDLPDATVRRSYALSATNKLGYIWRVINRAGYDVDVVSVSNCVDDHFQYVKGSIKTFEKNNTLRLFPGICGGRIMKVLGRYWLWICFLFWFLLNIRRGERVFVYHSLSYCRLLSLLKGITGCLFIGEIEELYQDVSPHSKRICDAEYQFIRDCDAYIFPTDLLNIKLNTEKKPYTIIHGIYEYEYPRGVHWNDSNIHIVYAGTFDPNKGGARAAVMAAKYLPGGYHIHICGFGSNIDTECLVHLIEKTNDSTNSIVTYDGMKKGEEFVEFLQKCQIGLSTQDPNAAFSATSFPSKILTYLSNGLNVVSIRIPVVEFSRVGQIVTYYDEQTPQEIARAILSCRSDRGSAKKVLDTLDNEFLSEISILIQQ